MNRATKLRKIFNESDTLGVGLGAADGRGSVLIFCALGTQSCVFRLLAEAQKLVLTNGQLEAEARQFALHVLVTVRCGEDAALGIALLSRNLFERGLGFAQFRRHLGKFGLRIAHLLLEMENVGVKRTQFALHPERARFIGASAGDHSALIASAVRSDERKLRIVARQLFSGGRAVC